MSRRASLGLGVIVAVGAALRLDYLVTALHSPGFIWQDPDGYLVQAFRLVPRGQWQWTFNAVEYSINGQRHALPPGYSVFLSMLVPFPHFPVTALVAQMLLSVASILMMFALGRRLHSVAAGLLASAAYALWVPNILNVWSTSQETVYLPLILLTFVLLGRAIDRDDQPLAFVAAGVVMGAAALTRSMPVFFVLPAAGAHVVLAPDRRRATAQSAAFVAGFLVLIAPYSVALSRHFGAVTIIDTHGSIHLAVGSGTRAPGLTETARALSAAIAAAPAQYFRDVLERARSLVHVNGGRILQIYVVADDRRSAAIWKILVHAGTDALLVFGVVLAPVGAALSQRPRIALLMLLWAAVNTIIASLGGFGGARLRMPFEPLLFLLAAVACVGGWRRPSPASLGVAVLASCLGAAAVVPQLQSSLRAWPDYGVTWPTIFSRHIGHFTGTAGVNVLAADGVVRLGAEPADDSPVLLGVRLNGVIVRSLWLPAGNVREILVPWPARGMAFVELEVDKASPGHGDVRIFVPGQ